MNRFDAAEITWENSHEKARSDTADMAEARSDYVEDMVSEADYLAALDALCAVDSNLADRVEEKAQEICAARLISEGKI